MELIDKQLIDINLYIRENNIKINGKLLCEGVTFYDLRSFLTIMRKQAGDTTLKDMLKALIKTIAKLEVRNVPVPTIAKLKSISPEIFPN